MARVKDPVSFIKYAENYLAELKRKGKMGTHNKTNATLLKLKIYLNNADLSFDELDLIFLKAYERYLRETLHNCTNTIHGNLKIF